MQETVTFKGYNELLSYINNLTQNSCLIYRGYNNDDELYPNLIRNTDFSTQEFELLSEFERYGLAYFSASNAMEFLSTAQHYCLPTRLIDFTSNPFIALFFSIYKEKPNSNTDEYYKIIFCDINNCNMFNNVKRPSRNEIFKAKSQNTCFLQSPYAQNLSFVEELRYRFKQFGKFKKLCVVKPNYTNIRITMQQGLFVIPITLDREKHKNIIESNTKQILIHKSLRTALLKYLDVLGYNSFRLMPDLSSVCSAIKQKVLVNEKL